MGTGNAQLDFTQERTRNSRSRAHIFEALASYKGVPLGHLLLLNTNGKSYIDNLAASSDLGLPRNNRNKVLLFLIGSPHRGRVLMITLVDI